MCGKIIWFYIEPSFCAFRIYWQFSLYVYFKRLTWKVYSLQDNWNNLKTLTVIYIAINYWIKIFALWSNFWSFQLHLLGNDESLLANLNVVNKIIIFYQLSTYNHITNSEEYTFMHLLCIKCSVMYFLLKINTFPRSFYKIIIRISIRDRITDRLVGWRHDFALWSPLIIVLP